MKANSVDQQFQLYLKNYKKRVDVNENQLPRDIKRSIYQPRESSGVGTLGTLDFKRKPLKEQESNMSQWTLRQDRTKTSASRQVHRTQTPSGNLLSKYMTLKQLLEQQQRIQSPTLESVYLSQAPQQNRQSGGAARRRVTSSGEERGGRRPRFEVSQREVEQFRAGVDRINSRLQRIQQQLHSS